MLEIKNAPSTETKSDMCNFNNFIISENVTKVEFLNSMPDILEEIASELSNRFCDNSFNCIANMLIVKTAQMITAKRVQIDENGKFNSPNWFALNFMPSGHNKDRITDDLSDLTFNDFKLWFEDKSKDFYRKQVIEIENKANSTFTLEKQEMRKQAYIEAEKEKIRNLIIEITNGTKEGLYSDALAFKGADFGSIFIKISEFATYLNTFSQNNQNKEFMDSLNDAYNEKIGGKCTKFDKRLPDVVGVPVNALFHSDYTMIAQSLKSLFTALLQTGFGRRSTITFQETTDLTANPTAQQKEKYRKNMKKLGNKLHNIFLNIPDNAIYKLDSAAHDNIYMSYVDYINNLHNNTDDELLKKEIKSREFKTIKLSGLYACLNHPKDLVINEADLASAIISIQAISQDFKHCMNYKPTYKDKYSKLLDFFIDNVGTKFKKVALVNKYNHFGFKREEFRHKLDNQIVDILKEMALEKGYMFCVKPINNNTGNEYYLIKNQNAYSTPVNLENVANLNNNNAFESYTDCNSEKSENQTSKTCKSENSTMATDLQDLLDVQEVE